MASNFSHPDRSGADDIESKPSVALLGKAELDIPIKQELEIKIDEDSQSVGQERPIKRSKEAVIRSTEFFRKLFSTRRGQSKIECRKCGHRLLLMRKAGRSATLCIGTLSIREHVITHVHKPMYSCLHCDRTYTNWGQIRAHMQNVHKRPAHYSDFSDTYEKEIFETAIECFGEKNSTEDDENPIKNQYAINQYFIRLYRAHWKNQKRIVCNICGLGLTVRINGGTELKPSKAISHATIHLEKFLFSCRHCSHQSVSLVAMVHHLRKHHALGGHPGNYVNRMHEYKNDLIDLFERCYGRKQGQQETETSSEARDPGSITTAISENAIRSRGGSNKIFTERQLHCHRLLVQFVKQGSIKCRVCSHLVNVRQQNGGVSNQRAIWHASTHVEKPLYKCKKCEKDIHVMSSVYRHMKKEHGITKGVANKYEDRSSELHAEILDALTRSFDWTGEDSRAEDDSSDEEDWSEEM